MKLLGSFSLVGSFTLFRILELHSSVSTTISYSANLLLLAVISFRYLAYFEIPCKTLIKDKLIRTYFRSLMNFSKHSSSLFFTFMDMEEEALALLQPNIWRSRIASLIFFVNIWTVPNLLLWNQLFYGCATPCAHRIYLLRIWSSATLQSTLWSRILCTCQLCKLFFEILNG